VTTRLPWLDAPLRDALGVARRHHALLIHGPAGVGQFELALLLAQAWLCSADAQQPCGACADCLLVEARNHPDLRVLIPAALRESLGWDGDEGDDAASSDSKASRAKPSKDIRIDAVRAAIAFAQLTSARGRCKVIVLYPAERLNAVAANALLKTLEEPPGDARFVLATGVPQALPATVRSRCQPLHLPVPPTALATIWLRDQGVDEADLPLAVAGGQPLEALAAWREGATAQALERLPRAVRAGDAAALAGWSLPRAIDVLHKLCHDEMALAVGAPARYFAPMKAAPGARLPALQDWARALARAARHAEHPWLAPLMIESLVLQGQRACAGTDAAPPSTRRRSVHSSP
jgi:DNA polymerase-3 subunit delta'